VDLDKKTKPRVAPRLVCTVFKKDSNSHQFVHTWKGSAFEIHRKIRQLGASDLNNEVRERSHRGDSDSVPGPDLCELEL